MLIPMVKQYYVTAVTVITYYLYVIIIIITYNILNLPV